MTRKEVLRLEKENGIATIWLDHQIEKMNVVSPEMMGVLDEVFHEIKTDDAIKGVVIISAKKDFIAGADIKAFAIEKKGDFRPIQAKGHQGLLELELGKKPVVAAVHGTAYGLGVELPLACHAIVCSDHSSTKFALPEVKLGLLPGGGGTQRLPKRVGLQKALDMMLTGKNIYPYPAKKMGLVDEVTNVSKLHSVATQICQQMVAGKWKRPERKKTWMDKFLDGTSIGRSLVFKQAKKMSAKQTQGNYPAVPAIIDCVETGLNKGNAAGYERELVLFEELMLTPESAALRSLFFAMSDNKKNPYAVEGKAHKELKTLGMLGAGFMGAGITEVSINKGINVLLKDLQAESLQKALQQIWSGIAKKLKYKTISKTAAEELIARVQTRLDYSNFDTADIVIEAVVENMKVKKAIFKEIEANCAKDVIIASNTSSLSLTEMSEAASKPEQVIGMHYFSPVPKMPLLEIVKTEKTSNEVIAACYDFGVKQGKTVIVVKDGPGFYVNRILAPYLNECLMIADEGVALDVIDRALIKKGFPVGPISLLDEVGLDIAAHVAESSAEALSKGREGFEANTATTQMFKDGRLGKKNKKGFYKYEEKKGRVRKAGIDPDAYKYFKGNGDKQMSQEEIQDRALLLMLNEAVMCLEEGIIANTADGNIGAVFGIGFLPFTGGPFRYIDQLGASKIVSRMEELKAKYGVKFQARPMLLEYAKENKKFCS
ncbi:MAG: enoyl-CoA hydratase/isomerase family protein [Chitinophagales bacterium]|nr:enoyl-CoA hydratase/isomerase family protein [Chitinophagales bacterium]